MKIFCREYSGSKYEVEVDPGDNIMNVKRKLDFQMKVCWEHMHLMHRGKILTNKLLISQIRNLTDGSILFVVPRSVGGGGDFFQCVDLNGKQCDLKPMIVCEFIWNTPENGLNLFGTCTNPDCVSLKGIKEFIVMPLLYGFIQLCPLRNKFPCPACHPRAKWHDIEQFMFTPTNFVLKNCKSKFTFQKRGDEKPSTMETSAVGDRWSKGLVTFEENGAKCADYYYIQIITEEYSYTPNGSCLCDRCNQVIGASENRNKKTCGHVFHQICYGDETDRCVACPANMRQIHPPVSTCSASLKSWCDHIDRRLSDLISFTSINITLLATLVQNEALHSSELEQMRGIVNNDDKSMTFYTIVKIRPDKKNIFIDSLKKFLQFVPASILEEYVN